MIAHGFIDADVRPIVGIHQISKADSDFFEPIVLQVLSNAAPNIAEAESAYAVAVFASNGSVMLKPPVPDFYSMGARIGGFYKTDKFTSQGFELYPVTAFSGVWHASKIDYLSEFCTVPNAPQFFTNELALLPEGEHYSEGVASYRSHSNAPNSLETITASIRSSQPLPIASPEIDHLLNKVVSMQGVPSDIPKWAKQLADDTGDLVD